MIRVNLLTRDQSSSFAHRTRSMIKGSQRQVVALVGAGMMALTAHAQEAQTSQAIGGQGSQTLNFSTQARGFIRSAGLGIAPWASAPSELEWSTTPAGATVLRGWEAPIHTETHRLVTPQWSDAVDYMTNAVDASQGTLTIMSFNKDASGNLRHLTLSNLKVDLTSRTIRVDLTSTAEGFVDRKQYELWTFDEARGGIEDHPGALNVNATFHGLFFKHEDEAISIFHEALNLTKTSQALLKQADSRTIQNNLDPLTGKAAGFGWINLTGMISVVDESPAWMMMFAGGALIGAWSRRKQSNFASDSTI